MAYTWAVKYLYSEPLHTEVCTMYWYMEPYTLRPHATLCKALKGTFQRLPYRNPYRDPLNGHLEPTVDDINPALPYKDPKL